MLFKAIFIGGLIYLFYRLMMEKPIVIERGKDHIKIKAREKDGEYVDYEEVDSKNDKPS